MPVLQSIFDLEGFGEDGTVGEHLGFLRDAVAEINRGSYSSSSRQELDTTLP